MESTFNVFNIVLLLGGLAFFLFAMGVMSNGLERLAGGKMEKMLRKMTSNPFKGMVLGAGITAVVQSSSTVTVMLVGLVNSGIMELEQTIPVIMGSNIGTTITAWFLSLAGISSSSIAMQFLKPKNFAPLFALVGVIMTMAGKTQKKKDVGSILTGFGILMYGMVMMSDAMSPLADMPSFNNILTMFNNPLLGVLVGTLFTALIQSSAASVGVLQALSVTGVMTYGQVVPIIMGQNIGTCISAILACIGTNKNAKRVAVVHVMFNVIGTVILLSLWLLVTTLLDMDWLTQSAVKPAHIATIHTVFNVVTTVMVAPFYKKLGKLARVMVREGSKKTALLDEHLLGIPAFAVRRALQVTTSMAQLTSQSVKSAIGLMSGYNEEVADEITTAEEQLDNYEDQLQTYLVKVSKLELADKDVKRTTRMLHSISNFERIGDYACGLIKVSQEKTEKDIVFPESSEKELNVLYTAVEDLMDRTTTAFAQNDQELAETVEPLRNVIDHLIHKLRNRQVKRLMNGDADVAVGFVLSDLLTALERISGHCSNVAVAIIESENEEYSQHEYINEVKAESVEFKDMYNAFKEQYSI